MDPTMYALGRETLRERRAMDQGHDDRDRASDRDARACESVRPFDGRVLEPAPDDASSLPVAMKDEVTEEVLT